MVQKRSSKLMRGKRGGRSSASTYSLHRTTKQKAHGGAYGSFGMVSPMRLVGSCSLGALSLIGLTFFCPIGSASEADAATESKATKAVVNIGAATTFSIDKTTVEMGTVTPTGSGSTVSSPVKLTVSTNNATGYDVYINTQDSTNNMTYVTNPALTGTGYQIAPLSSTNVALGSFPVNQWGYAYTAGTTTASTYNAVPKANTRVGVGASKPIANDVHSITFGAKVDSTLAAGQYANNVLISIVANASDTAALMLQEQEALARQAAGDASVVKEGMQEINETMMDATTTPTMVETVE